MNPPSPSSDSAAEGGCSPLHHSGEGEHHHLSFAQISPFFLPEIAADELQNIKTIRTGRYASIHVAQLPGGGGGATVVVKRYDGPAAAPRRRAAAAREAGALRYLHARNVPHIPLLYAASVPPPPPVAHHAGGGIGSGSGSSSSSACEANTTSSSASSSSDAGAAGSGGDSGQTGGQSSGGGPTAWVVQEYFPGGDLAAALAARRGRGLNERTVAARLARPLLETLAAMHEAGAVHRDVKPANVLLDAQGCARLCDFDLAVVMMGGHHPPARAPVGTVPYMAPELFLLAAAKGTAAEPAARARVGPSLDVWSLGACVFELVSGRRPFAGASFEAVAARVLSGQREPLPSGASEGLRDFIGRCLTHDASARPSAAELLAHPWIRAGGAGGGGSASGAAGCHAAGGTVRGGRRRAGGGSGSANTNNGGNGAKPGSAARSDSAGSLEELNQAVAAAAARARALLSGGGGGGGKRLGGGKHGSGNGSGSGSDVLEEEEEEEDGDEAGAKAKLAPSSNGGALRRDARPSSRSSAAFAADSDGDAASPPSPPPPRRPLLVRVFACAAPPQVVA